MIRAGRRWPGLGTLSPLPFFYFDLFDLGYEAVGELDPSLELIADWQESLIARAWFITCARGGCACPARNLWEQVDAARAVIRAPGPFGPVT